MKGLKVKEFIERNGENFGIKKQEELAKMLGVSDQTVSNWVKGRSFPTHQMEDRLFRMGMTIEEIFGTEIWNIVKAVAKAELSLEMFDRKSDFFLKKLIAKIDNIEIK
jgi:transcriptional regulator with XRE-family HTH domain